LYIGRELKYEKRWIFLQYGRNLRWIATEEGTANLYRSKINRKRDRMREMGGYGLDSE
jgi:hypothetical protein